MPRKIKLSMTAPDGAIAQVKIRLLGISPMIWRRLLVSASCTLQELHGVIQAAMGWEGLHLYMFEIRAVHYGSADLSVASPQVTLENFRFRTSAKITYVYDMMARWEHEIRIEDRFDADEGKRYPVCIGGRGTCPPEDCGGPEGYLACRDEAQGLNALEDFDTMVCSKRSSLMASMDCSMTRTPGRHWKTRSNVPELGSSFCQGAFHGARSISDSFKMSIAGSCTSGTDQPATIAAQQIGGEGRHDIAVGRGDLANQSLARKSTLK